MTVIPGNLVKTSQHLRAYYGIRNAIDDERSGLNIPSGTILLILDIKPSACEALFEEQPVTIYGIDCLWEGKMEKF